MVLARTGGYPRDVEKLGQRPESKHRSALLELEIAELYTRHSPGLKRFAEAIAAREEIQNDAVQETFLRYMVERRCGRSIANPKAWLFQTLRNFLLDRLKKASCRNEVTMGAVEALFPAVDADDPVERRQAAQAVASALTAREMECLTLRAQGMSYEEIGAALRIRPGTVGALLTRVHRKLGRDRSLSSLPPLTNRGGALCHLLWEAVADTS